MIVPLDDKPIMVASSFFSLGSKNGTPCLLVIPVDCLSIGVERVKNRGRVD